MTPSETEFEDTPLIFIIIGEARMSKDDPLQPFNALLAAADDNSAAQIVLESLQQQGYSNADLHQIGNLDDRPEDAVLLEAYNTACAGEVALVFYRAECKKSI